MDGSARMMGGALLFFGDVMKMRSCENLGGMGKGRGEEIGRRSDDVQRKEEKYVLGCLRGGICLVKCRRYAELVL